jgi:hypothetical protein
VWKRSMYVAGVVAPASGVLWAWTS